MSYAIRAAVLLALGLTASCTVTPVGELTAAQCDNRSDDDDDEKIDCADPDCLAFATCRDTPELDAGELPPADGDSAVPPPPPPPPPPVDAGRDADTLLDGGTPVIDAAVAPCSADSCASGEQCVNGRCVPDVDVTGATYQISVESAVVPELGNFGVCFDACAVVELVACACLPDPYVVVTLRRGSQTITVGVTDWVSNTTDPVWSGDPFTVELRTGDELIFQAFDFDPDFEDPEMLRCKPDLGQIPTGKLVCGSTAGHIDATIVALR